MTMKANLSNVSLEFDVETMDIKLSVGSDNIINFIINDHNTWNNLIKLFNANEIIDLIHEYKFNQKMPLQAIRIAKSYYGYNLIEAREFVNDLEKPDLFEIFDLLPTELQEIFNNDEDFSCGDESYEMCERLLLAIEHLGYVFDYGLDGCPTNLRKIN